jgi:hypothetical protein
VTNCAHRQNPATGHGCVIAGMVKVTWTWMSPRSYWTKKWSVKEGVDGQTSHR